MTPVIITTPPNIVISDVVVVVAVVVVALVGVVETKPQILTLPPSKLYSKSPDPSFVF